MRTAVLHAISWIGLAFVTISRGGVSMALAADAGLEFFETKVRPLLIQHCYECHSGESVELQGGLRLDSRPGWQAGGDSGGPALIPGNPTQSLILQAVRHELPGQEMPPHQSKLPRQVIQVLEEWVAMGAPDPRDIEVGTARRPTSWQTLFRERLNWWSLQTPSMPSLDPALTAPVRGTGNVIDSFVVNRLQQNNLSLAPEADRATLARRLSFVLTGLPTDLEHLDRFLADDRPFAYEAFVDALLQSPHFGEHWARHWMDIMHYADTHGYEWDIPAKNAWMYRDYLVRSFNRDVPFDRFLAEQIAGDLLPPRVDPPTGLNESLIATMALRLGERRHGDNADVEGISQEAVANVIDTIGKAFLGTTLACSQCHDHKLDAVPQSDYYALAGILMSTRWGARCVDALDPNVAVLEKLRNTKSQLQQQIARLWQQSLPQLPEKIERLAVPEKPSDDFPVSLTALWGRCRQVPLSNEDFARERARRQNENQNHLTLVVDFSQESLPSGWRSEGWGMQHGLAENGEIVVALDGDRVLQQLLPAGRWTHRWSSRLAGAIRSDRLETEPPRFFSIGSAGGIFAASTINIDNAYHSERMTFWENESPRWFPLTVGKFGSLEGSHDALARRVYLEFATKTLNNNFPPRSGNAKLSPEALADPRSWFGVTRLYAHPENKPPLDELDRFSPIFEHSGTWGERIARAIELAIDRWGTGRCTEQDVVLLNDALTCGLLPNDLPDGSPQKELVTTYRALEQQVVPDRTIGALSDWNEGQDERLAVRGSYTELGSTVSRGKLAFLSDLTQDAVGNECGRYELAQAIVSPNNPLTARVFVNRIWSYVFGQGIVRTTDDFGHLGELPSHPELLNYLAHQLQDHRLSVKQLIRLMVTSSAWRQSGSTTSLALTIDPDNRLYHHMPMRRLEAESIRDALLFVSGSWDSCMFGPPIDPYRNTEDPAKRLFSGPMDGLGRRSLYTKITLMEPPRLMALFNQPLPKVTVGRRDITNVPSQSLAMLNDPFVVAMADRWSQRLKWDGARSPQQRARSMFATALGRMPSDQETSRLVQLTERCAQMYEGGRTDLLENTPAWRDVAHALFNLQEFIYVR